LAYVEPYDKEFKGSHITNGNTLEDALCKLTIGLFKDGTPEQLKMNLEITDDLLKECEKLLNHNAKVYKEYLAALTPKTTKEDDQ